MVGEVLEVALRTSRQTRRVGAQQEGLERSSEGATLAVGGIDLALGAFGVTLFAGVVD